ncbi:MAG: 16S rRNA (cytidine(1402)-2'-O)-methyltransferase [Bacteroidetes bacterium]|nr:16S rRNA (cytidine(1402)-2'-O)-methyltransferase [Bacteroidota bacterium]
MMQHEKYINEFEKYFPAVKIEPGVLYVVATPIGNLEDISFRALHTLKSADLIACEDTRVTAVLLNRYGIKSRLVSFHARVENSKSGFLTGELKVGKTVALVSDAGTPGISDPGAGIISECAREGIKVVSVPGATALMHALVISGFKCTNFYFQGFLPQKGRENLFNHLKAIKMPIVIYESKFRIRKTLAELSKYFGNKSVSVSRELSKMHETTYRGTLGEISANLNSIKEKGEFTLVINNI